MIDCQNIRQQLGDDKQAAASLSDSIAEHLDTCQACQAWLTQSSEITKLGKEIPQFDVPEALTQNILKAVANHTIYSVGSLNPTSWAVAIICGALATIYLVQTSENLDGIEAWLVGFLILLCLKLLIAEGKGNEAVHS